MGNKKKKEKRLARFLRRLETPDGPEWMYKVSHALFPAGARPVDPASPRGEPISSRYVKILVRKVEHVDTVVAFLAERGGRVRYWGPVFGPARGSDPFRVIKALGFQIEKDPGHADAMNPDRGDARSVAPRGRCLSKHTGRACK